MHFYFLNQEVNKSFRFVPKRSDGGNLDPAAAGEEAMDLPHERYIGRKTRNYRGEAIKTLPQPGEREGGGRGDRVIVTGKDKEDC